jgi:hypothetical protein
MRLVHPSRSIVILFLVLVVLTFFVGSLHAFGIAHAASSVMPTPNPVSLPDTNLEPTPVPTPAPIPGDTTGIIALAIIIVMIVAIDAILGNSRNKKKISLQKKS